MSASVGGRPRSSEITRRRKEFIRLLNEGVDPMTAAATSGHPAHKALETLSGLGFVLTTLHPEKQAA